MENKSIIIEDMSTPTVYLHGYSGDKHGLRGIAGELGNEPYVLLELPGFGTSEDPPRDCRTDIVLYARCVWEKMRQAVPEGPLRVVGHSHGAMVAFTLAHLYPEDIESITLLCPVARPQWPARIFVQSLRQGSRIIKPQRLTNVLSRRLLVDAVSTYSMQRNWSRETRRHIYANRRREAAYYRPSMIDMFAQTLTFSSAMEDVRIDVPTIICFASQDNVAGKKDAEWYRRHCSNSGLVEVNGGHLVVIAEPAYVAHALAHQAVHYASV